MKKLLGLVLLLATSSVLADKAGSDKAAEKKPAAEAAPPPAPEIKKTVTAMAGKWNMTTTLTMPGAQPVKFPEKIDCKPAVQGRALTCSDTFKMPGAGAMEFAYLVGYDVETKSVHIFAIGSSGEVHDHKCAWKDDNLECDPYKGTMEGAPMTELVSFAFAGNNLTIKATVKTKDGDIVTESTGKRAGK